MGMESDEAVVYGTLLTEGQMRVSRLASITRMGRSKLYRILSYLQEQNAVNIVETNPMVYSSASPDEYFNLRLQRKENEIRALRKKTENIIEKYRESQENASSEEGFPPNFKFRFLRSEKGIVSAANREIKSAESNVRIVLDRDKYYMFRNSETVRLLVGKVSEGVKVRIVTELKDDIIESLDSTPRVQFDIRFRESLFFPTFVIVDRKSIILVLDDGIPYRKGMKRVLPVALHVNSINFIQKMGNLFNYTWNDAKPYVKN